MIKKIFKINSFKTLIKKTTVVCNNPWTIYIRKLVNSWEKKQWALWCFNLLYTLLVLPPL